eukprot:scaffold312378_cov28-Tisochrysis_lutea.AAC.1
MWNSNVSAPLAILVSFALASSACFIFFYTQLIEIQGEDGPFDLSRNWRDVATSRGGDIESLPSESTAHAHDSYESAFPPDAAPSTPLRALKSLVNATTSARRSAVDSIRSFSFGSIPSFTASVVQYSPFRSSLSATLDEASSFPQPSPLTVDVVGASEMLASQAPPEIFKASSPAFLSPGRTTKSYMTYHIEARAPGSRRTHRCAQRFSSFDFFLAELTNGESLQIGSSAVHLSSAARSSIEGWRRRLLLERMAAVGDRSRDAAVVTARVELLRRLLHEDGRKVTRPQPCSRTQGHECYLCLRCAMRSTHSFGTIVIALPSTSHGIVPHNRHKVRLHPGNWSARPRGIATWRREKGCVSPSGIVSPRNLGSYAVS